LEAEAHKPAASAPARSRAQARLPVDERRRRARLHEIEAQIADLEGKLSGLSLQLESPPPEPALVQALGEDYVETQNEINALLAEWEQLHLASAHI
jgi:hypothetical protein